MKEYIYIIQNNQPIKKIDGCKSKATVISEARQSGVRGRFEIHYEAEIEERCFTYGIESINERNQLTSRIWFVKEKGA